MKPSHSFPALTRLAVAALAVLPLAVAAQQKTLVVAGYGGSFEAAMRKHVIPAFEAKHGVKVEMTAGTATDNLAKVQAQKASQSYDILIADDGPMYQAIEMGLCTTIEGLDKKDLYPAALFEGDKAVAYGQTAVGIMYNEKFFKEKGWAAPTSWNDLSDPKYKGLLIVPPISNAYGLYTLIMYARLNGGGEKNIEPGFKAFDSVGRNVVAYESSPAKMSEMFQSGQAVIAPNGSLRYQGLAHTGFPVKFVYPKDGTPLLRGSICPVAKSSVKPWAHEFIHTLLSAEVQTAIAKEIGNGPVNVKVDPNLPELSSAPVGERSKNVLRFDWVAINATRPEWTKRWNREVER